MAERFERSVHVQSDAFFRFVSAGFIEPWKHGSRPQNDVVMRAIGDATAAYAESDYFTIADGIFIPGFYFEVVRDVLTSRGLHVSYAILLPPLPTITARAAPATSAARRARFATRQWLTSIGGFSKRPVRFNAM